MNISILGTEKCPVCNGEILIAEFNGGLTYTHNGWCYTNRNALVRECSDQQKIKSVLRR